MESLFNFLKETGEAGRPMLSHLGILHTEEKILTLWCGVNSEGSPMKRLEELAIENQRLRNQVRTLLDENESLKLKTHE